MSGIYKNRNCTYRRRNRFTPNKHQEYVKNYFLSSRHKGLLLYHKLGSGKTCTSIIIADAMLQQRRVKKVYVLTPGSLRENWISEYCRVCGNPSIAINDFVFITYNYEIKDELAKIDFNKSLVIIDEVHNVVNSVKNFSSNSYAIYYKIIKSNCRVLALSGTPVFNNTIEFAILASMLSDKFNWVLKNGSPEQVKQGKAYWDVAEWAETKQNSDLTKRLISGLVSFYGGDLSAYPDVRYIEPYRCTMSSDQYQSYLEKYEKEAIRRRQPPSIKLKFENPEKYKKDFIRYITAVQWTSTRAESNCLDTKPYNFIPDMFNTDYLIYTIDNFKEILSRLPGVIEEEPLLNENGKVVTDDKNNPVNVVKFNHVEEIINNLKQENGIFFGNINVDFKYRLYDANKKIRVYGWMSDEIINQEKTKLLNMSRKYSTLLTNIALNPDQKHIIFSFYKTVRGTLMLHSFLKHCGIKSKLYSGDLSALARQRMIEIFNDPSNSEGQNIQVMLLTEAGSEGISLLGVNHVHIVESSTSENKNIQAIGRAVRYKSHENLPENRRFVNVYRYWSVWNEGSSEDIQIDEQLYEQHFSKEGKKTTIDEFQTLLENYSIEKIGPGEEEGEEEEVEGKEEQFTYEKALEEQKNIQVVININSTEHTISIPSTYSIEDTTKFLIDKYLLPPLTVRDRRYTNVLIDLSIVNEDSPSFEPEYSSVDIYSQDKIIQYIEGNLILYTYNIEDVENIKLTLINLRGKFRFTIRELPPDITLSGVIEKLEELVNIYNDIDANNITLFDNKSNELKDETNFLNYFLNKIPIFYEINSNTI